MSYLYIYGMAICCLASQSGLSKDSGHNKKIATTSFGNSTTSEDYSSTTLGKSRDKTGALGKYICDC